VEAKRLKAESLKWKAERGAVQSCKPKCEAKMLNEKEEFLKQKDEKN
jgi:hypothetical protein